MTEQTLPVGTIIRIKKNIPTNLNLYNSNLLPGMYIKITKYKNKHLGPAVKYKRFKNRALTITEDWPNYVYLYNIPPYDIILRAPSRSPLTRRRRRSSSRTSSRSRSRSRSRSPSSSSSSSSSRTLSTVHLTPRVSPDSSGGATKRIRFAKNKRAIKRIKFTKNKK